MLTDKTFPVQKLGYSCIHRSRFLHPYCLQLQLSTDTKMPTDMRKGWMITGCRWYREEKQPPPPPIKQKQNSCDIYSVIHPTSPSYGSITPGQRSLFPLMFISPFFHGNIIVCCILTSQTQNYVSKSYNQVEILGWNFVSGTEQKCKWCVPGPLLRTQLLGLSLLPLTALCPIT